MIKKYGYISSNARYNQTTKKDFFRILDVLEKNKIPYFIEGGWGVDALVGHQTRGHRDIDVDFDSRHEKLLITLLESVGYKIEIDERPTRVEMYHAEYGHVDIHPFVFCEDGSIKQANPDGGYFEFDRDRLTSAKFEGRIVPCYTAETQILFHSGYELRDVDKLDLNVLNKIIIKG